MIGQAQEWFDSYMASVNENMRLSFPFCEKCGRYHWYPKAICPHCHNAEWGWKQVSGEARLFTWTEVQHPFSSDYAVPFTVLILELVEAPDVRVVSNLDPDAKAARLEMGMRMHVTFGKAVAGKGASMPTFAPVGPIVPDA